MNFYTDNENLSFYLHHPEMGPVIAVREKNFAQAGEHPEAPANAEEAMSQYLFRAGQLCQLVSDSPRRFAADVRINLVENQNRNAVRFGQYGFRGEHDARNFTG